MADEDRERFLSNIISDCERLTRLISNVLDLEKYESGSQRLQLQPADVGVLVQNVAGHLQAMARERNAHLQLDLPDHLPPALIDADLISQVLHNLLGNALKFCDPEQGRIGISLEQNEYSIEVTVRDNGPGIPAADREHVFEKFYQARNQTRRKPSGSGLGLAICKNIVQLHQGEIWIESSTDSGGTKVLFTLPIYRSEHQYAEQIQDTDRR